MSTFLESPPAAHRDRTTPTRTTSFPQPDPGGSLRLTVTRPDPATAVIAVDGELVAATAPRLAHLLGPRLTSALRTVVIDLSAVTFLDTTGLGVLVHAWHQATITGRTLKLITGPGGVERALESAGLDTRA
ncbi:STAS domain-containing protein [Amycolatopsis sp. WAC 04182]|uniref:STAS domain-containing protein n=1 Tax=Amycolatopsis sp. WAC 04182 TaxID=2203198 RepID=UPI0013159E20|nr:STAS domain-containing protein [Amycolatopsis sp. WAC 04182]